MQCLAANAIAFGLASAFLKFAGRMSPPRLRLVGLWQAFQQASIAVKRLGDILDIPQAPHALTPCREGRGAGRSRGLRIAITRALLKCPKILIFDEAVSNLDQQTAEHFARTINTLKGKVTMLFITHQVPKGLRVDEVFGFGGEAQASGKSEVTGEEKP